MRLRLAKKLVRKSSCRADQPKAHHRWSRHLMNTTCPWRAYNWIDATETSPLPGRHVRQKCLELVRTARERAAKDPEFLFDLPLLLSETSRAS